MSYQIFKSKYALLFRYTHLFNDHGLIFSLAARKELLSKFEAKGQEFSNITGKFIETVKGQKNFG